jgi:glycine/D-amino acid oxidase-like deaminating enzyme
MKIAGGGIIGMSIAWRLAQRGLRVEVFDAGRVGGEASWAGAGMLAPGGEVSSHSRLAQLAVQSLQLYPAFVAELESESGCSIDFQPCGAIEYTPDDSRAQAQAALGIRSQRLSPTELFYPDDASVDPRHVTRALRVACERRGVAIHENSPVTKLDGPSVLAAGAWSSQIQTPVPIEPSFPIRGHLVSYRMPPGSVPRILRSGHTYILQRRSGLTIAGSESERAGFDRSLNQTIVADIDLRARAILPQLPAPHESWLGFRPATESLEPQIGPLPGTEIFLAYGHYRNGILLAPITAQLAADRLT